MTGADPAPSGAQEQAQAQERERELTQERARTLSRLMALTGDHASIIEASRDSNADDEHDPEGATIAFERSQVESLVRQARAHLDEVDAALARVEAGTYASCEVCGRLIPPARLEARPVARTCVTCAARDAGTSRTPRA